MPATRELILPPGSGDPDLARGSVQFIGTATVLIRYAGFTILTDPNFLHRGERVKLGYGLRATRRTDPALEIEQLPPLDLVLLSHMHEDHFDRVAEQRLSKTLPIISTGHAKTVLTGNGFSEARSLTTWETLTVVKGQSILRVTAMPGRHGPGPLALALPPVMGSMLEFGPATGEPRLRIYITGDTLLHDDLNEIPRRYPEIDLALLHLGGTRVLGLLLTMDARQGVQALRIIRPKLAIPIHYNDYTVFKSPLRAFVEAVKEAGLERGVRYLRHGETYTFDAPAR
jgi:L-ascorbate metabolism protein UlaG (beta-lactamase superfamily)